MTTESNTVNNTWGLPRWFDRLAEAYQAGANHAFILHLNTADYATPGKPLRQFLAWAFANREIVCYYNRAAGIEFATEAMKDKALALLGLDNQQAQDPALAALGYATGQQEGELPKDPTAALPLLDKLLRQSEQQALVIMDYAETILPAADNATMPPAERTASIILQSWGRDLQIANTGNILILITANLTDLHPAVRAASAKYMGLEIPLPDQDTRKRYLDYYLDSNPIDIDGLTTAQIANLTAGLGLIHIEDLLLKGASLGGLTLDIIRQQKQEIIEGEYAGLLEILEPTIGFDDLGGSENLKAWALNEIINPQRQGRPLDMAQGALLVGNPGTGKTYFVKALAKEIGFNAIALNFENILGGIVGTSERNLARALAIARSLAPVLIFIDELDQSDISARGNSSGNPVAKNLFNMTLRFLGDPDNRGKIIFIGASNRPDLIDPALLRFGRIDAIIPRLLPDQAERKSIALAQAKTQGVKIAPAAADLIAERTDKYSGADIAAIITKARKIARMSDAGKFDIYPPHAEQALEYIRPATIAQADYYTALALEACNDSEYLPEAYRTRLNDRSKLTAEIAELEPRKARRL